MFRQLNFWKWVIHRIYTGHIQDIYRLISDVDVSLTRTVLREKYVRMPSVWRDAGRDGDIRVKDKNLLIRNLKKLKYDISVLNDPKMLTYKSREDTACPGWDSECQTGVESCKFCQNLQCAQGDDDGNGGEERFIASNMWNILK